MTLALKGTFRRCHAAGEQFPCWKLRTSPKQKGCMQFGTPLTLSQQGSSRGSEGDKS